jgi:hypothetical protein
VFLLDGFDLVAVVAGDDADARALGERRHDFAGEAENSSLVGRAVADDEGAAAVGQDFEDATERGAEPLRVLRHELRIGLAKRPQRAASRLLVSGAPAILDLRPQARLDNDAAGHVLAERREEAGECLRRALGAGRDRELVAAPETCPDLQRRRNALGGEDVLVGVRVPPELDLPAHLGDASSERSSLAFGTSRFPRARIETMSEIDGYGFGRVTIDGREETSDVIVLPGRVVRGWWRKEGHGLVLEDLDEVLDELPERLLVGTGAYGQMRPDPATLETLRARGIEVEVLPTADAVQRYGQLDPRRTAAALHLTC